MKRQIAMLAALAVCVMGLLGSAPQRPVQASGSESQLSVKADVAGMDIVVNGDLSEWTYVNKNYVSYYDVVEGQLDKDHPHLSEDSYFQLLYKGDTLYIAAVFADNQLNGTGLGDTEWIRMLFDFGEVDGQEENAWCVASIDPVTGAEGTANLWGNAGYLWNWDGMDEDKGEYLFDLHPQQKVSTVYSVDNNRMRVEAAFKVKEAVAAKLAAGESFQFNIRYEDNQTNWQDADSVQTRRYFWSDGNNASLVSSYKDGTAVTGTVTLTDTVATNQAPQVGPVAATAYGLGGMELEIDGDLTEWENVEKTYLHYYDVADGVLQSDFTVSQDSYFQLIYGSSRLYVAAAFADEELNAAGDFGSSEWARMLFDFGELAGQEENAWTVVSIDPTSLGAVRNEETQVVESPGTTNLWAKGGFIWNWDGVDEGTSYYEDADSENGVIALLFDLAGKQTAVMRYDPTAKMMFLEASFTLKTEAREKLAKGETFGFNIRYEDYQTQWDDPDSVTVRRYFWSDGCKSLVTSYQDGTAKTGTITLGDDAPPPTHTGPVYENPTATIHRMDTDSQVVADGVLNEWGSVEKHNLNVYDYTSGGDGGATSQVAQDAYFQMTFDSDKLYFAVTVPDKALQISESEDGRDWCKLVFDLDGVAKEMDDPDSRALSILTVGGDGWHPQEGEVPFNWEGYASGANGNAFQKSAMYIRYKNGVVYVEGYAELNDPLKKRLVNGAVIGVGVKYEDHLATHMDTKPTDYLYLWGDDDYSFLNNVKRYGKVTLDTEETVHVALPADAVDPEVRQPTANAGKNTGAAFDKDGNLHIQWTPTPSAASYQINVFNRFEAMDGYAYFYDWKVNAAGDATEAVIEYLDADTDYGYQIWALDASGSVIAVYEVVNFSVGGGIVTEPTKPSGGTPSSTAATTGGTTTTTTAAATEPRVPDTGAGTAGAVLPLGAAAVLVLALARKRRR